MFRKDTKGFLPELMEKMYAERKVFKKKMLKSKQQLVDIEAEMKRRVSSNGIFDRWSW
jgi:DNA polymerase elongation subunit (family B)